MSAAMVTIPSDLPIAGTEAQQFLPSQAWEWATLVDAWNPWTHANVPLMVDHSQPVSGADNYGEVYLPGDAGELNATWGGMPYPVQYFYEESPAVAMLPTTGAFPAYGQSGQYIGQQQAATAVTQSQQQTTDDFWSVLIGAS